MPAQILLFAILLTFLIAFVQLGAVTIAFGKLGLSASSAYLLLFSSLFGSLINLPLFQMRTGPPRPGQFPVMPRWRHPGLIYTGRTVVALNVGGGLIPVTFSIYLLQSNPLSWLEAALGTLGVGTVSYLFSRPVPGLGIGMPVLVAPVSAALFALIISPEQSAPLAYVSGTLGVLLGADILRFPDIRRLGAPIASIGGAGTFDGIFITGLIAVLLA